MDLQQEVLKLNQSDFLRHYLFVKEHFEKMKQSNPAKTSVLLHYVKNPDKVKQRVYKKRKETKNTCS